MAKNQKNSTNNEYNKTDNSNKNKMNNSYNSTNKETASYNSCKDGHCHKTNTNKEDCSYNKDTNSNY